jgi:hypothetical protein
MARVQQWSKSAWKSSKRAERSESSASWNTMRMDSERCALKLTWTMEGLRNELDDQSALPAMRIPACAMSCWSCAR